MNNYNNLIDMDDYTVSQWNEIISLAEKINTNPMEYSEKCHGKIMATLFYEPSTRTQMSFQAAMIRLGGNIIGFDNPNNSSVAKGESLKDTVKIVSSYSDILVMRHMQEGSAKAAKTLCGLPHNQCRRWRTPTPHPNAYRPSYAENRAWTSG